MSIPSIAQYRKDSRRVTMSDLVDHSFGVFLVVFNLCLVSTIYGAYDILYVRQIFAIVSDTDRWSKVSVS